MKRSRAIESRDNLWGLVMEVALEWHRIAQIQTSFDMNSEAKALRRPRWIAKGPGAFAQRKITSPRERSASVGSSRRSAAPPAQELALLRRMLREHRDSHEGAMTQPAASRKRRCVRLRRRSLQRPMYPMWRRKACRDHLVLAHVKRPSAVGLPCDPQSCLCLPAS